MLSTVVFIIIFGWVIEFIVFIYYVATNKEEKILNEKKKAFKTFGYVVLVSAIITLLSLI